MTALEFLMPFLTVALLLGIGAVAVLCIRAERRLADRKNISLGNYKQKNYLFYVTKDVPVFVVALALLVADAVLVVLALTHPVVRLYAIPLGVSAPVAAVVAWLSFSRGKCARDLHVFDEYYVRVQDLLMSKERLESEIGVCRRRVDELRGKTEFHHRQFQQKPCQRYSGRLCEGTVCPAGRNDFRVSGGHFQILRGNRKGVQRRACRVFA